MDRRMLLAGVAALAALGGGWLWWRRRAELSAFLSAEEFGARHAEPLSPPAGPMTVFHLGHSLVGRDMPAMLAQMAGHTHHSQLGWGASLKQHWEPDEPVPGFETENAHPAHRPAREAIASGAYGAVILTEMVEIRDAIRYHDSGRYLAEWARAARAANPDVRVYLYETWHRLDDPAGWTERIRDDLPGQWEAITRKAMAQEGTGTIHLIPAGTAMAALVARIEAGEVPGLSRREDLFARAADGTQDMIHPNDLGAYFVALVHYATLYHRSPEGMPHALLRADGSPADAPSPEAARIMAQVAWQAVSGYAATGVAP